MAVGTLPNDGTALDVAFPPRAITWAQLVVDAVSGTTTAVGLSEFEVYALAAQPDFATWRASPGGTRFDAKTFEIKARPVQALAGARPGMSVVVTVAP